jgi:capsular polysaccharide biosynthesis protein
MVRRFLNSLRRRDTADEIAMARLAESVSMLREEIVSMRRDVADAGMRVAAMQQRLAADLTEEHRRLESRLDFAAFTGARLRSDAMRLEGPASRRAGVTRVTVGAAVNRRFSTWQGINRCATPSPDVRELWDRLIAYERGCADALQGGPSTILDVPSAAVSMDGDGTLRIALDSQSANAVPGSVVAVPRFTYAQAPRKLRNFGHWFLDCAPQVLALSQVAPDATFLMPASLAQFHRVTLSHLQIDERQLRPWDGSRIDAARVIAFESDGRSGGGRPLSGLMALRERVTGDVDAPPERRTRRLYVSRRDARSKRQWVANEAEVEAVFRSRGFEIVAMADCPLAEQARLFREARVVAGISGAGLVDLVFAAPGTHAIVLISDSLIRWYADRRGARSSWSDGTRAADGSLAALGDSPRFYAHVAAALEQCCHSFVGTDAMPLDQLATFVDDVLARVP